MAALDLGLAPEVAAHAVGRPAGLEPDVEQLRLTDRRRRGETDPGDTGARSGGRRRTHHGCTPPGPSRSMPSAVAPNHCALTSLVAGWTAPPRASRKSRSSGWPR